MEFLRKIRISFLVLPLVFSTIFSCKTEDPIDQGSEITIGYKITGTGEADIEYTGADGLDVDLNNETLPWEVSFASNFDGVELLNVNAACECKMTAEILINGTVVDSESGFAIIMVYTLDPSSVNGGVQNSNPKLDEIRNTVLITEGNVLSGDLSASDPDGDALAYSLSPSDISFISLSDKGDGTAMIDLAPQTGDAGEYELIITVSDANGGSDAEKVLITVNDATQEAGLIKYIINGTGQADIEYTSATGAQVDINNEPLPWEASFDPLFTDVKILNINAASSSNMTAQILVNGNEVDRETGNVIIMAYAYDPNDLDGSGNPTNSPPRLNAIGNHVVVEDNSLNVNLSASDADADTMTFSANTTAGFISITDNADGTAVLGISPVQGDAGNYNVEIKVQDSNGGIDTENIIVVVNDDAFSSSVTYIITGSGQVDLEYTDADGFDHDINNQNLPWEVTFEPNFERGTIIGLEAVCSCEMNAQILIDGVITDSDSGNIIYMYEIY